MQMCQHFTDYPPQDWLQMWLYCGYLAAKQGGCADLRSESSGKLENNFFMVAARRPHGCRTVAALPPYDGHVWAAGGTIDLG